MRRKRIEYHRHITKHYFEFDFCLTDRKLSATPTESSTSQSKDTSKRKMSINSQLQQVQSENLFQASLMPLFSQPSAPQKQSTNREDSLLLQIREDINKMVKIPTCSSSNSSARQSKSSRKIFKQPANKSSKSKQQRRRSTARGKFAFPSNFEEDIYGENSTTKNRLFANHIVKGSLERILYLWSIRIKGSDSKKKRADGFPSTLMFSNTSSTSRYMVCLIIFI